MSYTPNTWKSGDVVTSAKLNNIESGIVNSVLVVTADENNALDHTYAEIEAANFVVFKNEESSLVAFTPISVCGFTAGLYVVIFEIDGNPTVYAASSKDEYPVLHQG